MVELGLAPPLGSGVRGSALAVGRGVAASAGAAADGQKVRNNEWMASVAAPYPGMAATASLPSDTVTMRSKQGPSFSDKPDPFVTSGTLVCACDGRLDGEGVGVVVAVVTVLL